MRLIFGAITCDNAKATDSVTIEMTIQKTTSTGRYQNVFVHQLYQDRVNRESTDEDLDQGLLCESRGGARVVDDNKDIALIRLSRPLTDLELNSESSNINTICLEHSVKVGRTSERPLTAYAAGFGYKDEFTQAKYENAVQPYLSFIRYNVFQHGAHRTTRPGGLIQKWKLFIAYDPEVDTELQFGIDLDDNLQRDTAGVSRSWSCLGNLI